MKVVILAGGFGTRLGDETDVNPKPMVQIGGKPILWHIMKSYSHFGFNEFIILLGYKGFIIKEYFSNYFLHQSNITLNLADNSIKVHNNNSEPWKVTLLDTGLNSMTGGRIKRAAEFVNNESFLLTYGDGLSDLNISSTVDFHKSHGKKITMTAVKPEGRYGALSIKENGIVSSFKEKPKGDNFWINGGFFVCEPEVFDTIEGDSTIFENEPLVSLTKQNELVAYKHEGFWGCMDTPRDKSNLNKLWSQNKAPWKSWSE